MRVPLSLVLLLSAFVSPTQAMDINSYRAMHGRAPLKLDSSLSGLAYSHAASMARRVSLDHDGFHTERAGLGANAENVSYGCANEACAIQQWARSAPHRANMLRKDVTTYGLGSAVSTNGRRYWAMELGGAAPVVRTVRGRKQYLEAAAPRRR